MKDKITIVTGSSRGIGFAIAKEFAENHGAIVIVCSRSYDRSMRAAEQINGKIFAAKLDVTNDASIDEFMRQILSNYKQIDILINNAGYAFDKNIWYKKFHEVTIEEFDRVINVDLMGSVRLSRAVIPIMLQNITGENRDKNDGSQGGVIINISSTPAIVGLSEGSPYTIAKAANIALTKSIAKEYGNNHIRAYSLALGNIATLATYESMTAEDRQQAAEESPMKRWGKPEEVAKVAACIADSNFSFATGNTIVIDGGTVLY
ncbi:MAG: SDR family oxidoreductase [Candidatus Nitrosocosmicus sp.]